MPTTALAKSVAPNTYMSGGGANDSTKIVRSSMRRSPSAPMCSDALRPCRSRPRASSVTAASSGAEPRLPEARSSQTTSRAPGTSRPAMTVAIATASPVADRPRPRRRSRGTIAASTRSTNTSSVPPQVSPTANASSSDTP